MKHKARVHKHGIPATPVPQAKSSEPNLPQAAAALEKNLLATGAEYRETLYRIVALESATNQAFVMLSLLSEQITKQSPVECLSPAARDAYLNGLAENIGHITDKLLSSRTALTGYIVAILNRQLDAAEGGAA